MLAVLLMMQLLPVSAAAENPEEVISDVYTAPVFVIPESVRVRGIPRSSFPH